MNTLPVPNLNAPLVDTNRKVATPWNSWFQQFSQDAAAVATIVIGASPFSYTANSNGTLIISGGTVSAISLIRGSTNILLSTVRPLIIPISIGDTVSITYSVLPTIQFLGA